MAKDFRPVDRSSVMLLPPDLREWLAEDHLAWFVIEAVEQLDVRPLVKRAKLGRAGRAPYDPRMLLALLVYAYAVGQRSSRQIERLCETDVAFRVISAQQHPDHSTISRFRADLDGVIAGLFAQVLRMCAKAGMGKVGVVAIDGTKVMANASKDANRDRDWFAEQAAKAVREHAETDAAEDEQFGDRRGDELPPELADPRTRAARIKQALEEMAEEDKRAAEAAERTAMRPDGMLPADRVTQVEATLARMVAAQEEAIARHASSGKRTRGPVPVEEHAHIQRQRALVQRVREGAARGAGRSRARARKASRSCNLTDPQSRVMHVPGGGTVQGYNAQLAVSDDQIVLAVNVTQQSSDRALFQPMVELACDAVRTMHDGAARIGTVLADAGYCSNDNLTAPGPDRLIATASRKAHTETKKPRQQLSPHIMAMTERLQEPGNIDCYKRRGVTVEPVNAHLKDRIGLRRFARRGLRAAQAEASLAAMTLNLLKIHRARTA